MLAPRREYAENAPTENRHIPTGIVSAGNAPMERQHVTIGIAAAGNTPTGSPTLAP